MRVNVFRNGAMIFPQANVTTDGFWEKGDALLPCGKNNYAASHINPDFTLTGLFWIGEVMAAAGCSFPTPTLAATTSATESLTATSTV